MPPNQPSNNDRKEESSSPSGQAGEQAAAGEDVKMKEAKPEKPEETWDDIPEHVLKVRPTVAGARGDWLTMNRATRRRSGCRQG